MFLLLKVDAVLKRVCKLLNMQKVPMIHHLHLSSFTVKNCKVTLLLHFSVSSVCPGLSLVASPTLVTFCDISFSLYLPHNIVLQKLRNGLSAQPPEVFACMHVRTYKHARARTHRQLTQICQYTKQTWRQADLYEWLDRGPTKCQIGRWSILSDCFHFFVCPTLQDRT